MIEKIWREKHGQKVAEPALSRLTSKLVEPVDDGTTETWRDVKAPEKAVKKETRQEKWKRLNPEKVRAAQAKLMRKRRAAERDAMAP